MKAVIIFDNFGPYHLARLRASTAACDLLALQVTARSEEYAWENEVSADGFKIVTLFPAGTSEGGSRAEFYVKMNHVLDEARPQVVVVPGWASLAAFAALSWCSEKKIPAIVMSESTAWDDKRSWWKEWLKRRLIALYSTALVGGKPQADYIGQLGMAPDRIFLGYDAVDNGYFQREAVKVRTRGDEARKEAGLPPSYFLASARFIGKKNLSRLLEAYALYRSTCGNTNGGGQSIPWSLVLLGDGSLREALMSQVARLNLKDCVLMPGFKQYPDLPTYYALAGAFIHASTTEQWGLVVNEAMASALPVLVSDQCGCAADLVHDGRNGFTFNPLDTAALAALMTRVSAMTPEARKAMGGESERIIAEWGPQRFSKGLNGAMQKALAMKAPKTAWLSRLILRGLSLR